MKHVHSELIHAWADGARIEVLTDQGWTELIQPFWDEAAKYRIKDLYRELKEAAADPTKEISTDGVYWVSSKAWKWNLKPSDYLVRDKPKAMKRVKLFAYLRPSGLLTMTTDNLNVPPTWKRVPHEDKMVDVEE